MSTFTAFLDANVLYGARLRSLLLTLAQNRLFRPRWSDWVHEEWTKALKSRRPDIAAATIDQLRTLVDAAVPDCLVTGFESLIPGLQLPDRDDRHVLAAAIHGGATCIVTFNLADFPLAVTKHHNILAVHPDDFLLDIHGLDEDRFAQAVREDIAHYRNPPLSFADYAASLAKAGMPKAAALINGFA